MSKQHSLKNRLIAWISVPIFLVSLVTLVIGYAFSWYEIEEVYDAQLVHMAKLLHKMTQSHLSEGDLANFKLDHLDLQHDYERNIGLRIWSDDQLISQSENTQAFDIVLPDSGFSSHEVDGNKWRFFVYHDSTNQITVETSERYDVRYELINQLAGSLLFPELFFIPLIFLIVWFCVNKALKPVITISNFVNSRNNENLIEPIEISQLPIEISPLVNAVNQLFRRIEESMKREREFTDYAAHELRTPLAAMKMQTQVLIKKYKNIPNSEKSLENLKSSIDRAVHLVSQLLALSRFHQENLPKSKTSLTECIYESVSEIYHLAQARQLEFDLQIEDQIYIESHKPSIKILLNNLLDNAIKYSEKGSTITVKLNEKGVLQVCDFGQGILDVDKKIVFKRFVRIDKSPEKGSGLGLAIASRIAKEHKVEIVLKDNHPKGLIVEIDWHVYPALYDMSNHQNNTHHQ